MTDGDNVTVLRFARRQDWMPHGNCHQAGVDMFPTTRQGVADAVAMCNGCPVLDQCRRYAIEAREEYGVWGGLTEAELRAIRRGDQVDTHTHGTIAGHSKHIRQGTPPCDACRQAYNAYRAARYVRSVRQPVDACGSEYGYKRHRRQDTEPCDPCRSAHAAGERRRAANRRQTQQDGAA